jgi:hypothetical protein
MAILIVKADGTEEPFNPEKLIGSLIRAGAEHDIARTIAKDIERELYPNIPTAEIYRHAFSKLRDSRRGAAARYSLKRAILELGPSGFPFEAYLSELFRSEGARTEIDQIIAGACVEHEVDVVVHIPAIAAQSVSIMYIEAKFHNAAGFKTDLKTVLYVKARLDDILAHRKEKGLPEVMRGMVATNTKFTSRAAQYAACAGVEILSWEEPLHNTLQDRIEAAGLYPITALTTLTRKEKMALLSQKIVLCSALTHDSPALADLGITGHKADRLLEEVGALCTSGKHIE